MLEIGLEGWIIYLDDDNMLLSDHSVTHLMTKAQSINDLVIFQSQLGRVTPTDTNMVRMMM